MMLQKLVNSFFLRAAVFLSLLYGIGVAFLPVTVAGDLNDGFLLASSIAVIALFMPTALAALHKPKVTPVDQLIMGIVLAWVSNGLFRAIAIANKFLPMFLGQLMDDASMFLRAVLIVGALLHLTSPARDPANPHRQARIVAWTAIGGLAITAATLVGRWWIGQFPLT